MLFKHDIEVKYSVFGKIIFFTWGHVNPLSAEVNPKMAKFAMKKTKFCQTSSTFIWPQNQRKCLNFDNFVDMVILRGQNVYTRLWHSMG